MAIILQMRERMEEMQHQIQEFVQYIQQEVMTRANARPIPRAGRLYRFAARCRRLPKPPHAVNRDASQTRVFSVA